MTIRHPISLSRDFRVHVLADGCELYAVGDLPTPLDAWEMALNDELWRTHYARFSVVICNPVTQEVLLIRDHFGLAPLYYDRTSTGEFIIGESIADILARLPYTPSLLDHAIIQLFSADAIYTDETIYQGIYRVEPGHMMLFKANGSIVKRPFWQLNAQGPTLHYENDQDYLDHFSCLMSESLKNCTKGHHNIAAEFSAGLDSCAVYTTARRHDLNPKLYMHEGKPGSDAMKFYNSSYERYVMHQYPDMNLKRVSADAFDPIQIFKAYADWFSGPAPYLFFMFAHPVHRAVVDEGHSILLSGFGGDQCASGQIPLNFFMPELIRGGLYRAAWQSLSFQDRRSKRVLQYLGYCHPGLYAMTCFFKKLQYAWCDRLKSLNQQSPRVQHPWHRRYYRSVREAEWSLLQGPDSHEVRMRIEYSSLVSKKMGFEYRYPLLYPKLLEFMQSLPLHQKRREGRGRWLMRRYLAQNMSTDVFEAYRKAEGLGIVPDTFEVYQKKFMQGCYQKDFKNLPYDHLIHHKNPSIALRHCITGFMLKACLIDAEA